MILSTSISQIDIPYIFPPITAGFVLLRQIAKLIATLFFIVAIAWAKFAKKWTISIKY